MRHAINYLVERGMLVRKRGVGTQIVHPKVRRPVELTSLYDDLRQQRPATAHRGPQPGGAAARRTTWPRLSGCPRAPR